MRNTNIVYKRINKMEDAYSGTYDVATYKGIGLKLLTYLLITVAGAFLGILLLQKNQGMWSGSMILFGLLTFVTAFIAMTSPKASLIAGSLYCLFEGIFLGVLSLFLEAQIPGIIITVVLATISVVLVVAVIYMTKLVKVGNRFYHFLMMFSGGFIFTILFLSVLQLFPAFSGVMSGPASFIVSAVSTLLASLFLLSDLKQAQMIVDGGMPKELEWMAAFGFAYTILWIYIELLRLVFLLLVNNRD